MPPKREIRLTIEFKRNVRQLAKKFRHIRSDLQPLLDQLATGETPGDRVSGIGQIIYKVRLQNSDINKGKRSGYRLLYYLKLDSLTVLLTIYVKSEQEDIPAEKIRQIIHEFDESRSEFDEL